MMKYKEFMKRIFTRVTVIMLFVVTLIACDEEYTTYSGSNYIMFSDTMFVLPVQNSEEVFEIPVAATRSCNYDRTVAVEIVDASSNAIEGRHYALENNTVTINAGELVANVRVRGIYENIGVNDSIGFSLRLLTKDDAKWDLYGTDTNVLLKKCCPFDINTFTGYCVVTSTYIMNYMPAIDVKLVRSEVDAESENTIVMKDYFYDGYDVKIKFDTRDLLNPVIKMEEQAFGPTSEAFNTIYGDGVIYMYQPLAYTSYYSSCEKFILQYMTLYVPGMPSNANTVGTFVNAVEWISDDEAEKMMREGY